MKSIVNRRENLRVNALPPEIPDTTNFVTKTDKASASKLGLVKIGDNVNVTSGGVISVPDASSEAKGVIKLGTGLSVNAETGAVDAEGGMTWTKIYDGTTEQGGTMDFVQGTDAFAHKFMIIESLSGDGAGYAFVGLEVLPANTSSIRVGLNRYDDKPILTITPTTFSQPSNMGASRMIIYVLD